MLKSIINTINNRQEISFTYSGLNRVALPCAVGLSTKGNDVLRCYQIQGGHVNSGHTWDLCSVSKISNLTLTGQTFIKNPNGYKTGDKGMLKIYAQIKD